MTGHARTLMLALALTVAACADGSARAQNAPLAFDLTVFEATPTLRSPDELHALEGCDAQGDLGLELDVETALVNPDGEITFWYWIVNDAARPTGLPDAEGFGVEPPYIDPFTFDACNNPNVKSGEINTVKLVVRDRPPAQDNTRIEDVKRVGEGDAPETSIVTLVWQIQVVNIDCCSEAVR